MVIKRVKYWCLVEIFIFYYIYTCYINSAEEGIERGGGGSTGQDIK
jgi:hypothetical protein